MREHYMWLGEGFLIVYSIADRASFQELEVLYEQILRIKDKYYFPTIVVSTKYDLEYDHQVNSSEGRALIARLHGRHMETPATTRFNVDVAFIDLVKLIRSYQKPQLQARLPARTSQMPKQHPVLGGTHGKRRGCGCVVT